MAEGSVGSSEERHYPDSDPTAATIDALRREIAHLSDRIDLKIEGIVSTVEARITAIDTATRVFAEDLHRVPTALQTAIGSERALTEEKFNRIEAQRIALTELRVQLVEDVERQITAVDNRLAQATQTHDRALDMHMTNLTTIRNEMFKGVQQQFHDWDIRMTQQATSSKEAINAALSAAKEATAKSEAAQLKAIEQLNALIQTMAAGTESKISDVKDRLTRIEGQALGTQGAKQETHQGNAFVLSLIGIAIAVLTAFMAIFNFVRTLPLPR